MRFEFATAGRIVFGAGAVRDIGALARELGRRAFVVTGRSTSRAESLLVSLASAGVNGTPFATEGEPTVDSIRVAVEQAREDRCDLVIGVGGGSALDAAKAVAAMLANPGELTDYLEVIGSGCPLTLPSPCIAVPTTAGTGSEVTRNAVIASMAHGVKVSLRSPSMLPRLALVDPEMTFGLPPHVTASTGLDALTQLIEPLVSCRAQPLTDGFCLEGIPRVARSLRRACERGRDVAAREDLALASLLSGLALANSGLGAVHGLAAPIGARFTAPHGVVCAALLPLVMEANLAALRQRRPDSEPLRRFDTIGRLLTGRAQASAEDGIAWVRQLHDALHLPTLSACGLAAQDIPGLVEKAAQASSMKGNPVELTPDELTALLAKAL